MLSWADESPPDMRIGKSEALDLLRKWSSESISVRCEFSFMAFQVVLYGKIALKSDDGEIHLVADDAMSQASVRIRPDLWDFDYADNRELSAPSEYGSILVLTPKGGERTQARIGFLEIVSDGSS
jgi:hypothetical protein